MLEERTPSHAEAAKLGTIRFANAVIGAAERMIAQGFLMPFVAVMIDALGHQALGEVCEELGRPYLVITDAGTTDKLTLPVMLVLSNEEFEAPVRIVVEAS
jgi:hypothetical protein